MNSVVGVFVSILLLIVSSWIAIFGGIGALLSRSRGGSVPSGLAWGTGLGPVGWLVIFWITRSVTEGPVVEPTLSTQGSSLPVARPAAPRRWDPWNR